MLKKADVKIDYKRTNAAFIRTKARWFGLLKTSICIYDEGTPLHLQENGKSMVVGMADDISISEERKVGKYRVCDGSSSFIKFSALTEFFKRFGNSKTCLQFEEN